MSIIVTVVASRRDIGFTMCSGQCPRIGVCVDANSLIVTPFLCCLGHVENESIYHHNFA